VADPGLPQQERTLSAQLTERVRQLDAVADATVTLEGAAPELPPAVTSDVYRIAAEALTNAARHARASRIETVVAVDDGDLCLTVRDDGRGLPASVRPGTQGLRSMRARARALGADLRIVGGRGGAGTVVELRVPR
jgi:signal transduction histidine kinase